MNLEDWKKLSPEEQQRHFEEKPIEFGKPMTKAQEEMGRRGLAASQLEEDAKVSTIDRLLAAAPEALSDHYQHTLHRLRLNYNSAIKSAESCDMKGMVGSLLLFEDAHGEIIDEMAHSLRRDILQSSEYDSYVRLLGLFERRTLPRAIEKILLEECKCGSK